LNEEATDETEAATVNSKGPQPEKAASGIGPLSPLRGKRPPAPVWFKSILTNEPESLCAGPQQAETLAWGEPGRQGILLVHGAGGHAHWWAAVASQLAASYRVATATVTGLGGGKSLEMYTTGQLTEELLAVCDVTGLASSGEPPLLIAHSFGGIVATGVVKRAPEAFRGLVLVDSSIRPDSHKPRSELKSKPRTYPDLETALARFRLKPPQDCDNLFLLDQVARASLKQVSDGWTWRFDPRFLTKTALDDPWPILAAPPCPLACVYGERSSLMTAERLAMQKSQMPTGTPFIAVPGAGHHLMLDQPLATLEVLKDLIRNWPASQPNGSDG